MLLRAGAARRTAAVAGSRRPDSAAQVQPGSLCPCPVCLKSSPRSTPSGPPSGPSPWDAVGTVCGDPDAEVARVLFAVDPVQEIVDEAVKLGADLLVTHHPLYLRGTTTRRGRPPSRAASCTR